MLSRKLSAALCVLATTQTTANSLEESDLERVTVYGSANPVSLSDYPGQVSVLSLEEIQLFDPSSMSALFRDVPGLEFSGGPRRTGETPSIRGRGGENVLILLDGARQSFISAHDGRFFVDPELIRRAEVVKGPASSLYGSGAVGGVLALETLDAADLLSNSESYGLKTKFGLQDANNDVLASITAFAQSEQFDLIANFNKRTSEDITLGSGAELSSDDDIASGLVKLGYTVNQALSLEASWQHFDNTAIEPNNGQGLNEVDNDVIKDITSDNYRLELALTPDDMPLVNASITLYKASTEVEEYDPSVPRTTIREIETEGLSLRNTSLMDVAGTQLRMSVGIDWYEDTQQGLDTNTESGLRGGVPDGSGEFLGAFAEWEFTLKEPLGLPGQLLVTPSIRYDKFKSEATSLSTERSEDSATSPRIATTYSPSEWLSLFASYSKGFRAPSLNELFLDGVHFSVPHPTLFDPTQNQFVFVNNNFVANTELTAERSKSYEFGFGLDFEDVLFDKDTLSTKVSHYRSDIENLIDLNVDFAYDASCFTPPFFPCSAGVSSSKNLDKGEIKGIELTSDYQLSQFALSVNYSHIEGVDLDTGSDLGSLTPDRLNLDARWHFKQLDGLIGTRLQLAKSFTRQALNTESGALEDVEHRAGYGVIDLYAKWSPSTVKGLSVNFGIDNLFDKDYERVFEGVSAMGRNVKASVSYTYSM